MRHAAQRVREEADERLAGLRGSTIGKSIASYRAKLNSYFKFCDFLEVPGLPVDPITVCRYIALFRNGRSAQGYITSLIWLCDALGHPVDVARNEVGPTGSLVVIPAWKTRAMRQVLRGSMKATAPPKRAPVLVPNVVVRMVREAMRRNEPTMALAYVLASNFMLRVQDELLPLQTDNLPEHSQIRVVWKDTPGGDRGGRHCLVIALKSRKNRPEGASLIRACTCVGDGNLNPMCPVHTFIMWKTAMNRQYGRLFVGVDYTSFTRVMRIHLGAIIGPDAAFYTSHGFRRGTAQAMLSSGSRLAEILSAGDWRSPAFLAYLDQSQIEEEAILDMLMGSEGGSACVRAIEDVGEPPMPALNPPMPPASAYDPPSGRTPMAADYRPYGIRQPPNGAGCVGAPVSESSVDRTTPTRASRKRAAEDDAAAAKCRRMTDYFGPPK